MFNTIILKKGEALHLTESEYKKFNKGDTIWGADSEAKEIKRWSIEMEKEAKEELAKFRCSYELGGAGRLWEITEYALEYCQCDDEGEFVEGSDFNLAEEAI